MKKNILILLTSSLFCLVYVSFSIVPPTSAIQTARIVLTSSICQTHSSFVSSLVEDRDAAIQADVSR